MILKDNLLKTLFYICTRNVYEQMFRLSSYYKYGDIKVNNLENTLSVVYINDLRNYKSILIIRCLEMHRK